MNNSKSASRPFQTPMVRDCRRVPSLPSQRADLLNANLETEPKQNLDVDRFAGRWNSCNRLSHVRQDKWLTIKAFLLSHSREGERGGHVKGETMSHGGGEIGKRQEMGWGHDVAFSSALSFRTAQFT
jgi:hypothetical protein